ncbi:hypothetical protein ES288_A01G143500v1 [Gossypium darwinii]|uniref:Uncharacterized protein n=1 Tax=Gossypium darwinii TaxID=34276 RepID=A0A5D2HL87_GOSDA|nr:hypothetical protein ES288_A01G143500v1 [Gossypium darwinii]
MSEPDPTAGRTYIWIITFLLLISIVAGGGCLLTYLLVPNSQSSIFLPTIGFTLDCMPWIFWIIIVVYRFTSRVFGFRMVIDSLYGNGNATPKSSGDGVGANDIGGAQILDVSAKSPPNSPKTNEKPSQIGEAKNVDIGQESSTRRDGSYSSNKSNHISTTSRESEKPLVLSMPS